MRWRRVWLLLSVGAVQSFIGQSQATGFFMAAFVVVGTKEDEYEIGNENEISVPLHF